MHIAVAAPNLTGRLHSTFELVSRLESEGHTLTYLCDAEIAKKIKKQGFSYVEIPAINFNFIDVNQPKSHSWFHKFQFHFSNLGKHYRRGKRILHLDEYKQIIDKLNPDMVLVDVELHDLIFTALASKLPVVLFHTWFSDKIDINLPPIRTAIIPGKGFSGSKLGISLAWIKMRLMVYGRLYINKLRFNNYRRGVFRNYAMEIGFSRSKMMLNTLPPLYSFKDLPILTMAMKEMEFPHTPEKNLRYIGPLVFENRVGVHSDEETERRLAEVLSIKKRLNKKLIYCSVSSFVKGDVSFLKRVIEAASGQNDWLLIMTLGGNIEPALLGEIPKNVFLFSWVPQLKVLENADCSINHAGINSINECLHFSVPILAYSGKYFDQNGNAARVAYHGIGIRGDKDVDNSTTIKHNISRILEEPTFRNKMIEMHGNYEDYRQRKLTPFLI
ncbi:MAG: glycosyltransferase [Maribacter sp.]|uniref:glycosyltransferase n=1 Tax=Maribacter sp. TaxID=1897614 RepID=UPI003298E55A